MHIYLNRDGLDSLYPRLRGLVNFLIVGIANLLTGQVNLISFIARVVDFLTSHENLSSISLEQRTFLLVRGSCLLVSLE